MAEQAHVSSIEAIESFRAKLIIYLSKARPTLEEVSADVVRTRLWLQNDQRTHWENQVRRQGKQLEQAQQALSSARLSSLGDATAAEQMAVQRARRAVEESEAKLKRLKQWNRNFDSRIQPLVREMEKLHTLLTHDMAQAIAYLAQTVKTLAAYTDIAAPAESGSPPPTASPNTAEDIVRAPEESKLPGSDPATEGTASK